MTDREKVIKGLGNCVEYFASKVEGAMFDEWLEESRKAIALLKAQEPRYTPREVRNALIDYGQHDLDIELGEVIKYDPVKIEDILMKGRRYHG